MSVQDQLKAAKEKIGNMFRRGDNRHQFATIMELFSALFSDGLAAKAKAMLKQEKAEKDAIMRETFEPYLNKHNIGLFINDKNIGFIVPKILEGLPKLDKHYLISIEPTSDRKDVLLRLSQRLPNNSITGIGFTHLSQLNQEQLFSVIEKFFPQINGNNNHTAGTATGSTSAAS